MAVTQAQKVDFLLKKIGFTKTKTGLAVDETLSGTKKAGFAEAIPSPLIIANDSLWNESSLIPATPPGSDTSQVKVYLASSSGHQMTVDSTVAGNRAFIAFSTYNNTSSARLNNWIDTQFGSSYLIKVFRGDPNSGGVQLSAAGSGNNDGWFFDYSAGVLNFNDTNVPSGVTSSNIYIVGYRYIGLTGAPTPTGAGNFTFNDVTVTGDLDVDGHTNLDNVSIAGVVTATTFVGDGDFFDLDVDGHTELDNVNISGVVTATNFAITSGGQVNMGGNLTQANYPVQITTVHSNEKISFYRAQHDDLNDEGAGIAFARKDTGAELASGLFSHSNGGLGVAAIEDIVFLTGGATIQSTDEALRITSTGNVNVKNDIDVDGHTNLDNVSIAGVTTFSGDVITGVGATVGIGSTVFFGNGVEARFGGSTISPGFKISNDSSFTRLASADSVVFTSIGAINISGQASNTLQSNNNRLITAGAVEIIETDSTSAYLKHSGNTKLQTTAAGISISEDLDVDGHTNLDNVSIAGVTTFTGNVNVDITSNLSVATLTQNRIVTVGTGGKLEDSNKLTFDGTTLGLTGNANFTGNLTVGGVLTYEDVKNVDSVGLITARSGIRVTSGVIEAQAGENKIPFLYSNLAALPNAGTYHGMFAHVHSEGRGYFAHAGNWLELVNKDTSGNVGLSGDLDVDGHTNLDNVSIAGVVTATTINATTFAGNGDFVDLDVDGHTNLDNVSVAGVSTFSGVVDINAGLEVSGLSDLAASTFNNVRAGWSGDGEIDTSSGNLILDSAGGTVEVTDNLTVSAGSSISVGTGVTIESNGQATFTGIVTASSFKLPDGSNVGGIESDSDQNTVGGTGAGINFTTAFHNTLFGYNAGLNLINGDENTFIGHGAGDNSNGDQNVAVGKNALTFSSSGDYNTAVGTDSLHLSIGDSNVAVGDISGRKLSSGNENVFLGAGAGTGAHGGSSFPNALTSGSNNIIIGFEALSSATTISNEITIGNSNHNHLRIPGIGVSFGSSGDGFFSGIVTATSFRGDGSQLTGISVDATALKDPNGNVKIQAQASGAVHVGIATFQDIDVDGHTNLDNVSIAGVSTLSGNLTISKQNAVIELSDPDTSDLNYQIRNDNGTFDIRDSTNSNVKIRATGSYVTVYPNLNANNGLDVMGLATFADNIDANGDLDVDGHTNLDNVSVAGVSTFSGNINVVSTDSGSSAAPELKLFRNSSSPANADYLGEIKFAGKSNAGNERNFAKITGKILDITNAGEDGILEFSHIKNGSETVTGRWRSDSLQLLNNTNFSVAGNATFNGDAEFSSTITAGGGTGSNGQYLKSTATGVAWESFPTMRTTTTITASAGQTTFSFSYNIGFLDVFVNGTKLTDSEFTATNGTSVVLAVGCFVGDIVDLISYNTVSGGGGAGGSITVQDEGSSLSTDATVLNFVGTGVVASGNGGTKTITINAGAGDTSNVTTNNLDVVGFSTFARTLLMSGQQRINFGSANTAIYHNGNFRIESSGSGGDIILKTNASGGDSNDVVLNGGSIGDLLRAHGTGDVDIINTLGIGGSITKASGQLDIRADNLQLKNAASGATYASFTNGGSAELNHNNTKRLETTSNGVNVIGSLFVNGSAIGGGGGGSGFFSQTVAGIHTLSNVGIGTADPEFDLDLGSYISSGVSVASTIRIIGENNSTAIRIGPGGTNNDITIIRVDSKDGTTDGDTFTDLGHSIKYMGSGSGVENRLAFWVDNTNKTKYEALSIYNNGFIGINYNLGFNGVPPTDHFTVENGTSKFDAVRVVGVSTFQNVLPQTDSTYDIGTNTVRFRNIYADTLYGDGSNLTGISGGGGADVGITTNLSGSFSATPGSPTTINTLSGYSSDDLVVEYTIYIKNGSNIQTQKLLAMRDGTTIDSTQFAVMFSSSLLAQFDTTISSGNILLRATPESGITGTTDYKIKREVM